jgi:hypothetical protein
MRSTYHNYYYERCHQPPWNWQYCWLGVETPNCEEVHHLIENVLLFKGFTLELEVTTMALICNDDSSKREPRQSQSTFNWYQTWTWGHNDSHDIINEVLQYFFIFCTQFASTSPAPPFSPLPAAP